MFAMGLVPEINLMMMMNYDSACSTDTYPLAGWTAIPRQWEDSSLTMAVVKEPFISDT